MKKFKIMSSIRVYNLDELVDMSHIYDAIIKHLDGAAEKTNADELDGWGVIFCMQYTYSKNIRIFKRGINYASDKEKEFTISIPIPRVNEAEFGLSEIHFDGISYDGINEKSCHLIAPNYSEYGSLVEYIIGTAKRAIDEALRVGLTVNGKKLKYK
jgi:hypothetical protein